MVAEIKFAINGPNMESAVYSIEWWTFNSSCPVHKPYDGEVPIDK